MMRTRSAAKYMFGGLVIFSGVGLALVMPWMAGAQSPAAYLGEASAGPC